MQPDCGQDLFKFVTAASSHVNKKLQNLRTSRAFRRRVNHRNFIHKQIFRKLAFVEPGRRCSSPSVPPRRLPCCPLSIRTREKPAHSIPSPTFPVPHVKVNAVAARESVPTPTDWVEDSLMPCTSCALVDKFENSGHDTPDFCGVARAYSPHYDPTPIVPDHSYLLGSLCAGSCYWGKDPRPNELHRNLTLLEAVHPSGSPPSLHNGGESWIVPTFPISGGTWPAAKSFEKPAVLGPDMWLP
uniref:Uncharacterized protein n=1 Tax=Eptatretus burgeri TaxID=7764 RepID=A0A8C4QLM1_EPTBU